MATISRSFYAARGDNELRGLNAELERLALAKEDFADLQASRQNDGVWLSLLYRENKKLRLEGSSIQHGAWFHKNTAPSSIELVFNVPVSKDSIVTDALQWITASSTTGVTPAAVTVSELGRKLTIPLPSLTNYTGPVTLSVDKLLNDEGEPLESPLSIAIQITESDTPMPQSGSEKPYTASLLRGLMTMGRVVAAFGMSADQMLETYLRVQGLENNDLLKVLQVAGPARSVELFVLSWKSRSPSVKSTSPLANSTIAEEHAPNQILVEFDQEVSEYHLTGQDGTNRVFYNGTPIQSVAGVSVEQVDERGMQWLFKSAALFTSPGNHVLTIRDVPNRFGDRPGGSYFIPWQVLPMQISGSGTPESTPQCQDFTGNGVQTAFALSAAPIACTFQAFLNGVFQHPDCYSIVGTTLTMASPPFSGALLRVMYRST